MHPVSQTQPELVFKNTTPLLRMTFNRFFSSKTGGSFEMVWERGKNVFCIILILGYSFLAFY